MEEEEAIIIIVMALRLRCTIKLDQSHVVAVGAWCRNQNHHNFKHKALKDRLT
jgi:hypothetical protein